MSTEPRLCAECTRPLPETARLDAKFCGDRCRQRSHGSTRVRLAGQVADWLAGQAFADSEGANRLNDLMTRAAAGAQPHQALAASCASYLPQAADEFGMAVLTAAAIPMPAGQCRTCYATGIASIKDLPLPIPDSATAKLLGPTCPKCLPDLKAAAQARMPPKTRRRATARPGGRPRSAAMSSSVGHNPQTCQVCEMSAVAAQTLTASGAPDAELAELAARSRTPHHRQPITGARLVSVSRRNGILRTRYAHWSPP